MPSPIEAHRFLECAERALRQRAEGALQRGRYNFSAIADGRIWRLDECDRETGEGDFAFDSSSLLTKAAAIYADRHGYELFALRDREEATGRAFVLLQFTDRLGAE